jgi:LysR family glycine cleavage system transcriptional activator
MAVRSDPPSTHLLSAFVAVSSAGSFSAAATKLGLTQSAVSQRIRSLESNLDARLFLRGTKGVLLTDAGRSYLPIARSVLKELAEADTYLKSRASVVRISAVPSLARCWIIPQLNRLSEALPGTRIYLEASEEHANVRDGAFDLGLRVSTHPDKSGIRIFADDTVIAVHRPDLLLDLRSEDPFSQHALLHDNCGRLGNPNQLSWTNWYDKHDYRRRTDGAEMFFSDASHAITAAIEGTGVTLVRKSLVAPLLVRRRLIQHGRNIECSVSTSIIQRFRQERTHAANGVCEWFQHASTSAEL